MFMFCVTVISLCAGCVTRKPEVLADYKTSVYVPSDLKIEHTENIFEVGFDDFESFVPTNVTVDAGQTAAVVYDVYLYEAGKPRPASPDWHGRHRDLDFGFTPCVYHAGDEKFPFLDDEFPQLSKKYVVEMDAAVVEARPGTMDDDNFGLPVSVIAGDPRFKILWKGHLEQVVK